MILGKSWYRALLERAPLDATFALKIIATEIAGNRPGGSVSTVRSDVFPASVRTGSDRVAN